MESIDAGDWVGEKGVCLRITEGVFICCVDYVDAWICSLKATVRKCGFTENLNRVILCL